METIIQIILIAAIIYTIYLIYKNNKNEFIITDKKKENFGYSTNIDQPILDSKPHILKPIKYKHKNKHIVNKVFKETQYHDAYRDLFSAINVICPVQKSLFNQQILPVTSKHLSVDDPFARKLVKHFIKEINKIILHLPETNGIKKDAAMNEHYENLGVNLNLYQETPENASMKVIKIKAVTLETTDAEKRYVINIILKKDLIHVDDQADITINFILPLDLFDLEQSFDTSTIKKQPIVIENIVVNGFYTNNLDFDVDCAKNENINSDDNLCPYDQLQFNSVVSENDIIKEMNRVNRLHQMETQKFVNSLTYTNNIKF